MIKDSRIYSSKVSMLKYLLPSAFITLTILAYLFKFHIIIVVVLGFASFTHLLRDYFEIIINENNFIFRDSNVFEKLMAVDNKFEFQEIKEFHFEKVNLNAKISESIFLVIIWSMLPHYMNKSLIRRPLAVAKLSIQSTDGSLKEIEFDIKVTDKTILTALEMIQNRINNPTSTQSH